MAKSTKPNYNVDGYPGLARTVVSRKTGTRINIWFNAEAGKSDHDGTKPWTVECEDHGKSKATATRTEARQGREDPASFCTGCKTAAKKGGPVKATPVAKKAAPASKKVAA